MAAAQAARTRERRPPAAIRSAGWFGGVVIEISSSNQVRQLNPNGVYSARLILRAIRMQPNLRVPMLPEALNFKNASKSALKYGKRLWEPRPVALNLRRNPCDPHSVPDSERGRCHSFTERHR
jgi:hypothetical protein